MSLKAASLNLRELRYWTQEISTLLSGAQLQGVHYFTTFLVLDFYAAQPLQLVFSLSKSSPWVGLVLSQKTNFWGVKKTTPIQQYLASHFKNQRIISLELADHGDRQLEIVFSVGKITVTLVPHLFNIELSHLNKKIYLFKPQVFEPRIVDETQFEIREGLHFSLNYFLEQIKLNQVHQRTQTEIRPSIAQRQVEDLTIKQQQQLVLEQKIKVVTDSKESAELQKELAQLLKKINRLQILIESPMAVNNPASKKIEQQRKVIAKNMQSSEARGRLGEIFGMVYVIGASGEDSLKLIRQAKAWHWWFHQRQGAGPHLILACDKNKFLSNETLQQVAARLVEYINKNKKMPGRYEMIATQIRFVRPIKGAKAGLVTYQNITTWQIDYPLV